MDIKSLLGLAREAAPASAGVAATGIGGTLATAPAWLIGVGQAAIVVIFTVKAIDKRLERYQAKVDRLSGRVEVLHGRIDELECTTCEQPRRAS